MRTKDLVQLAIGTKEVVVEDISYAPETNQLVLSVRPTKRAQCRCGICQRKAQYYDRGRGRRLWRSLDVGSTLTYIEAASPRVKCKEHGVVTAYTPWARHHSGFTRVFEETVAWLTTHTSKSVVSEFMRLNWRTVGEICERVYKDLEKQAPSRFDGLVNIGIDETSYKKGHKYITVVMNHDTSSVVWCGLGYGQEVLSEFFQLLTPAQRASIRCVSADGAKWIASCVEKYCPNAVRCADPFHVVSWATEALETVRRQAWSEAHKTAKAAKKRGPSRPRKGEQADTKKEEARSLKNLRFVLLRNPESLSENQKAQLEFLTRANPVLYRAYLLKEGLRLAVHASADEIGDALRRWMSWAQRCRIPEFRKLRMKIKRHFNAIVAAAEMGITNARVEAINNKIKLVIRAAYGFCNMNNMLSMIMLTCSSVRPRLPGR